MAVYYKQIALRIAVQNSLKTKNIARYNMHLATHL